MQNYKTTLCKKWTYDGKCPYQTNCMFAHGEKELMKQGEYIQQVKNRKKYYQIRKKSELQIKSPQIKSPLNPKAKEFKLPKPLDLNENENENNHEVIDTNDYDNYWRIIHALVIIESRQMAVYPTVNYHLDKGMDRGMGMRHNMSSVILRRPIGPTGPPGFSTH